MRIKIGIENGVEGRSLAWALDYPACFAYGADGPEAILHIPEALLRYKEWVDSHLEDSWMLDLKDFDIHLDETFEVYSVNDRYDLAEDGIEINAWFRHDWKLLSEEEIRRGLLVLKWSREDLLDVAAGLSPLQMDKEFEGERWSIRGVLGHIANAEHWYLSRLGLFECYWYELPEDVFDRLFAVRERLNAVLPGLAGMEDVRGVAGEFWSPRKILRRAAWHEVDHIQHIFRLITLL